MSTSSKYLLISITFYFILNDVYIFEFICKWISISFQRVSIINYFFANPNTLFSFINNYKKKEELSVQSYAIKYVVYYSFQYVVDHWDWFIIFFTHIFSAYKINMHLLINCYWHSLNEKKSTVSWHMFRIGFFLYLTMSSFIIYVDLFIQ